LLRFIEVVDFIDKEDGRLSQAMEPLRLFDDFFKLLHAGGDGGKMDTVGATGTGKDLRQSGFTAPRRAPENKGMELAAADHLPEQFARTEQMLLADEFVEA